MRHAKLTYVTCPATGRQFPIPAGGAADDAGADDDAGQGADDGDDPGDDDDSDDDDGDDEPLGPAGEKALREMKKRARAAERELRALKAKQDEPAGDDPDPDAIRRQVETEVRAEASRDRALDKVEAKAARKFQNPDLVRKLLADQADSFLDETGNPDVEAITEALDELLENEPYLGLDEAQRRRFEGSADGGSRNGKKPSQLTREDLKGMSPEAIAKAKAEGRLDKALGRT